MRRDRQQFIFKIWVMSLQRMKERRMEGDRKRTERETHWTAWSASISACQKCVKTVDQSTDH